MFLETLFKLLVGHSLADMSLQTEIMAKLKNRKNKPDYIPQGQKYVPTWQYWMTAHALIHGGMVYIATGNLTLGIIEAFTHWFIDFMKCENWINPHLDQLLHISLKVGYALALR